MKDPYRSLGVSTSATADDIRRAYRILARRYHPDVNPGKVNTEERFKEIVSAYEILSDPVKRRAYDDEKVRTEHESAFASRARMYSQSQQSFRRETSTFARQTTSKADAQHRTAKSTRPTSVKEKRSGSESNGITNRIARTLSSIWKGSRDVLLSIRKTEIHARVNARSLSVAEVSVTVKEAIFGVRKIVDIIQSPTPKRVTVRIPSGVRTGSVVKLASPSARNEEIVAVVRVTPHPFVSIHSRGVVVEIPVSIHEAAFGGQIRVPTVTGEVVVTVPPGVQSGTELRLQGCGMEFSDGTKGDLFARMMIHLPDSLYAVGLKEKVVELDSYYSKSLRGMVPSTLKEME